VLWEPRWIEMPVDFGFLAIQTGGNFCLQGYPLPIHEANTVGKRGAMRGTVRRQRRRQLQASS
jgi:hypothetical protein